MTPALVLLQGAAVAVSVLQTVIGTRVGLFGSGEAATIGDMLTLVSFAALYGWWLAPIFAAGNGSRGALLALVILAAVWTTLGNGLAPLYYCVIPCQTTPPLADIANVGGIVVGAVTTVMTWRAFRAATGPIEARFPVTAIVLIVASFALQAANVRAP